MTNLPQYPFNWSEFHVWKRRVDDYDRKIDKILVEQERLDKATELTIKQFNGNRPNWKVIPIRRGE